MGALGRENGRFGGVAAAGFVLAALFSVAVILHFEIGAVVAGSCRSGHTAVYCQHPLVHRLAGGLVHIAHLVGGPACGLPLCPLPILGQRCAAFAHHHSICDAHGGGGGGLSGTAGGKWAGEPLADDPVYPAGVTFAHRPNPHHYFDCPRVLQCDGCDSAGGGLLGKSKPAPGRGRPFAGG